MRKELPKVPIVRIFNVELVKRIHFTVVAQTEQEARLAAEELADNNSEVEEFHSDEGWGAFVWPYRNPGGSTEGELEPDCGVVDGGILAYEDYLDQRPGE